jgi:hypothetical protein
MISKTMMGATMGLAVAACAAPPSADPAGDEANVTSEATLTLTKDFKTSLSGTPRAGGALRVDYALERLPQCRGNVGGGGPAWNITGFYSENGSAAKTFAVTDLSSDGKDRVASPARIELSQGGDLALWFQVSSAFGCSEFDSQFGQNFHVDVDGPPPDASATITFGQSGEPRQEGKLAAGGKVKVRYEQDRLPQCRRVQAGIPQWSISGFASMDGAKAQPFSTGRPDGADREEIDAVLDLPRAGELSLWFEVTSVGGCHEFDSLGGANYRFRVD